MKIRLIMSDITVFINYCSTDVIALVREHLNKSIVWNNFIHIIKIRYNSFEFLFTTLQIEVDWFKNKSWLLKSVLLFTLVKINKTIHLALKVLFILRIYSFLYLVVYSYKFYSGRTSSLLQIWWILLLDARLLDLF